MSVFHRLDVPLEERDRNRSNWTLYFIVLLTIALILSVWSAWEFRERGTPDFSITQQDSFMAVNPELCVARRYAHELSARAADARLVENPELKAVAFSNFQIPSFEPRNILAVSPEIRYLWYTRDILAVNPELKVHHNFQED